MGTCGCSSENNFYKIDKNIELVMEKYEDCPDCGGENIQIHILKKEDRHCFGDYEEVKKKKLAYWMGKEKNRKSIILTLSDFEDSLKRKIEETFEAMWYDTLPEEELKKISDERVLDKIEKEFVRIMLIKIKEV